MSTRSAAETIVRLVQAFIEEKTWKQADLARRVGVASRTVAARLVELREAGVPLEREADLPHVYWSVPNGWVPGGVTLASEDVSELLRLLARAPRSAARTRLTLRLVASSPAVAALGSLAGRVVTEPDREEDRFLPVIEDAIARRTALRFRYFSSHRGALEWRHASVAREVPGACGRFIARCHRDDQLKWFRVDSVTDAALDSTEPYRPADDADIDALLSGSVDGFYAGGTAVACEVHVRDPDARWAARNLPGPMTVEPVAGGVRIRASTAGLPRLARWVVGLGAAATVETPALRDLVRALAEGALAANAVAGPEINPNG